MRCLFRTACLFVLLINVTGYATPVTVELSGWVIGVDDRAGVLEGAISVNDEIFGVYNYDSQTLDSNPSASIGSYGYNSGPFGITLEIGGLDFASDTTDPDFVIEVRNDYEQSDGFILTGGNNRPLPNGTEVSQILWQLIDNDGDIFTSDSLVAPVPLSADWDSNNLRIACGRTSIRGIITEAYIVPEPATLLLTGTGMLILRRRSLRGRGRQRADRR